MDTLNFDLNSIVADIASEFTRLESENIFLSNFKVLLFELMDKVDIIRSNYDFSNKKNILFEKNIEILNEKLENEKKSRIDLENNIIELERLLNESKKYKNENENLKNIYKMKGLYLINFLQILC
jgi:hypothetical protein